MRSDIQFIQQPEIDVHHYERGDTVRLTTANLRHEYQLDVYILRRDDKLIYGSVVAAAPKTDIPVANWEKTAKRWRSARKTSPRRCRR